MLTILLQDLKKAILLNNVRMQRSIIKELNRVGVDMETIRILLKEV